MEPRISFVTLGVEDLERSTQFYAAGLGFPQLKSPAAVSFFDLGPCRLALYPRRLLAAEAGISPQGSGFSGVALAYNVPSEQEVDRVLERAGATGGRVTKPGGSAEWGGYQGYFVDPDGFLWEVAWNPAFS
jgi:catechol 2,3-dioxygenase-like lactoylglutathione lyase family enzyme